MENLISSLQQVVSDQEIDWCLFFIEKEKLSVITHF